MVVDKISQYVLHTPPMFKSRRSLILVIPFFIIVAAGVSSCGSKAQTGGHASGQTVEKTQKEKSLEQVLSVGPTGFELWGIEFTQTPISETSSLEQQWGKAIAFIRSANWAATGFFISDDGLFLTNQHVFSRESCSIERCAGIQIIRNFAPRGDVEVYNHFQIIAQNKALDFALAKVDLPPGEKVPYLELATSHDDLPIYDSLDTRSLEIIGHPLGASLRMSPSEYQWEDNSEFLMHDSGLSGNSGSPVIDKATGRVVGIHHGGKYDEKSIDVDTKILKAYSRAISMKSISKALKAVFPKYTDQVFLRSEFFDTVSTPDKHQDILPRKTSDYSEWVGPSVSAWFGTKLGTSTEKEDLQKLVKEIKESAAPSVLADGFIWDWVITQNARGESFILDQTVVADLVESLGDQPIGENTLTFFKATQGMLGSKQCQSRISNQSLTPYHLSLWFNYCQTDRLPDGTSGFDFVLSQILDQSKTPAEQQQWMKNGIVLIRGQANRGQIDAAHLPQTMLALTRIAHDCKTLGCVYQAENLFTLMQRDPALVGRGSLKANF